MFIGHWSPALLAAAHKDSPGIVPLFLAAQLPDWVAFALNIAGVEHFRIVPGLSALSSVDLYDIPWSHSLVGTAVLALVAGLIVSALWRNRTAGVLTGIVVLSHWFLDLLVHMPDLTLAGHPPRLGLGLWNQPLIEIPLELAMTFGALWFYAETQRPPRGTVRLLAAVLLVFQLVHWFVPPQPAQLSMLPWVALAAFAIVTLLAARMRPIRG